MTTPRARLEESKQKLRKMTGNDVAQRLVISEVNVDCAVEMAETLVGLTVVVEDMANRSVIVMDNLIAAVDKAAAESANVAKKLNTLTIWIIMAAIASAIAAAVQAGVAVYTAIHAAHAAH